MDFNSNIWKKAENKKQNVKTYFRSVSHYFDPDVRLSGFKFKSIKFTLFAKMCSGVWKKVNKYLCSNAGDGRCSWFISLFSSAIPATYQKKQTFRVPHRERH